MTNLPKNSRARHIQAALAREEEVARAPGAPDHVGSGTPGKRRFKTLAKLEGLPG